MKIFDVEFDIDFWDADVLERYERATENYNKAYKEVTQRNDGPAEKVRNLCYIVFDFLDDLLCWAKALHSRFSVTPAISVRPCGLCSL